MNAPKELKLWRETKHLSQKDAAALVEVTAPSWCDWENGKKSPDIESAEAIEKVTGIPMSAWAEAAREKRASTGTEG